MAWAWFVCWWVTVLIYLYCLAILIVVRVAGQFVATYWPEKASQWQLVG